MMHIPFGEWQPDQPEYKPMNGDSFGSTASALVRNVAPVTSTTYGPMPTSLRYSGNTLTYRCQGSYSLYDPSGSVSIFAGDQKKLYRIPPGSINFNSVSKAEASFVGSITGTVLTVTSVGSGSVFVASAVNGAGITPATVILSNGTGTGGLGTYNLNFSQTVGTAEQMTTSREPYGTPAVTSGGFWSMTSFGSRVIAVNGSDNPQTFLNGTDLVFSDLAGSPPVGKYVAVIRDFVFIGNLSSQPYRVRWSGIGDPTSWQTVGSAAALQVQSDQQDLQQSDVGRITGLVGGLTAADGAVFMERGIYRVEYVGSPAFFKFTLAQGASGTRAPLSIIQRRLQTGASVAYYWGEEDFYAFDGVTAYPIGGQRFAQFFLDDVDHNYISYILAAADPSSKLIYWAYPSNSSSGFFTKVILYNWELNKATIIDLSDTPFEWFTRSIYGTGYTLDQLDIFGTLDALPASLDSPLWAAGNLTLSVFGQTHGLRTMTGPAMEPTIETMETQFFPGRRARIGKARPIIDGGTPTIRVGVRDRLTDPVVWYGPFTANDLGDCYPRLTGRYVRFRLKLPAASSFSHLRGIDVDLSPAGIR